MDWSDSEEGNFQFVPNESQPESDEFYGILMVDKKVFFMYYSYAYVFCIQFMLFVSCIYFVVV